MTLPPKNWWLKTNQCSPKNVQLLATEMFKSKTGVSPELMNDICHFVERPCTLKSNYTSERILDHTVHHGSESLSFLASKIYQTQ